MLTAADFPDYADILKGAGKPLTRPAVPFEGDVLSAVTALFIEIGPLPGFIDLPAPVNPEDYPEEELHFLIATGLAYTLGGAGTFYKDRWPGDLDQYSSNAHRWAKAYLNARDYAFFNELSLRLLSCQT